jgi:diaminohydroxyphosphoribosylaminopyrimidine deaminase/5-amino-6-(5-phosphoribosylamino)uracil reductase
VLLKLAVSADGKVALAGRKPTAITGGQARNRVHLMRAMNDAVLTGIGTVLADDPLLNCRLPGMHSPVRVVLDGTLRLPVTSRLVASARQVPLWVVTGEGASADRASALAAHGVEVLRAPMTAGRLDLAAALKLLAGRGITRLMVESGPILATPFLDADLVDEAAVFRAPTVVGADGIDALGRLAARCIDPFAPAQIARQRGNWRRHARNLRAGHVRQSYVHRHRHRHGRGGRGRAARGGARAPQDRLRL